MSMLAKQFDGKIGKDSFHEYITQPECIRIKCNSAWRLSQIGLVSHFSSKWK